MSSVIINLENDQVEVLKNNANNQDALLSIVTTIVSRCCRKINRDYFEDLVQKIFVSNIEVETLSNDDTKGAEIHFRYKVGITQCESKSYLRNNQLKTSMSVIC